MLPGGQLRVLVQGLPGSQRPERDGCCLEMIHRNGLGRRSAAGTVTYSAAAPGRSKPTDHKVIRYLYLSTAFGFLLVGVTALLRI